jgi:hypothetical protein
MLADIKADLPMWPDDVADQWLLGLANRGADTGWPPPEDMSNSWKYILGRRPLSWWKSVTWKLEERDLDFNVLTLQSQSIVRDMLDNHLNNTRPIYSVGSDGKVRFLLAANYIMKNGSFPKPIVAMDVEGGLSVIDGNHRMSALCLCQLKPNMALSMGGVQLRKSHQVWIGSHPLMETPL